MHFIYNFGLCAVVVGLAQNGFKAQRCSPMRPFGRALPQGTGGIN